MKFANCDFMLDGAKLTLKNSLIEKSFDGIDAAEASVLDSDGLSLPYMCVSATKGEEKIRYCMWDDIPVVYMPDFKDGDVLTLDGQHWTMRAVTLNAFTDDNDTLVTENEYNMFCRRFWNDKKGEIFFFENPVDGNAIVLITENPDFHRATLKVNGGKVTLLNGGYPVVLGYCKIGECEALCRSYYRHARKPKELIAMSNTWGDWNGFTRICEDFMLKEIDAGANIGIDIVQIDDGWQIGSTADQTLRDELGRRIFHDDYWHIHRDRFPSGIKFMTEKTEAKGMKLGLWFAPFTKNNYAALERDVKTLKKAYDEWGVRFFKLDMYWIESKEIAERFLEFLGKIYAFGDDVAVQLDITRNARVNYLCGREYGTVFAENRFTKVANSFPHRVLRNMWSIGHYIPTQKFQFEIINPALNEDKYEANDPFAPANFTMDYLFATVMLSNPLFWMEMQFVPQERIDELHRLMPVWKEHRAALSAADVMPVGQTPSGRSYTGFCITAQSGEKYLLLFNEGSSAASGIIEAPVSAGEVEILASNSDACIELLDGAVRLSAKPRTYVFAKIK